MIAALATMTSCHYLDIAPEMGMTSEEVFSNYANFKNYLMSTYYGGQQINKDYPRNLQYCYLPMGMDRTSYRFSFNSMTDLTDTGRPLRNHVLRSGSCGNDNASIFSTGRIPIFEGMYVIIRIANRCIEHIDMLQDCTEEDKQDLLGQAYFLRALGHMTLCNYYGGVPYVDHALQGNEQTDLPRLSSYETYTRAAKDAKTAYECFVKAGKVRRDTPPGEEGHLSNSEQNVAAGMAALALRSRLLLYAASPHNNTAKDPQAWVTAAEAASEALKVALEYGYSLEPFETWENNWMNVKYTNEQIWAWNVCNGADNDAWVLSCNSYPITNNKNGGAIGPTQNAVDMYETVWGDPLYTESDREAAYNITGEGSIGPDGQLHHYYEQNPYANRDPRFYKNVIFDGASSVGAKVINIYYDPVKKSWPATSLSGKSRSFGVAWGSMDGYGVTNCGYYSRKHWSGNYTGPKIYHTDPLIRLAELYLNYAEAANEAYGPNGGVPGQISALEAVNLIRHRAGMPDVLTKFTGSKESLRERIQNERTIELMDEGHHYFIDEKRWELSPIRMRQTLYGMYIESCTPSNEYPAGRVYTRRELSSDRQCTWKDEMYTLFLPTDEANKLFVYVNNPAW